MSIHVSGGGATLRRVVLSCDVPGCPIQVEPPAAERWRSDPDARSLARAQAVGWTHDPTRGTDYCPAHVEFSTPPATGTTPPRPTAFVRNERSGDPLDRDEYAAQLRHRLAARSPALESAPIVTAAQAEVVARLLDELAGVYRGEDLGALAQELAKLLHNPGATAHPG
jgi:hypothetical protein